MKQLTNIFLSFGFVILYTVLTACSSLPTNYEKKASYAATDTSQTALGKKAHEILSDKSKHSMMYLVNEGTDAFFARMLLLSQAERSID